MNHMNIKRAIAFCLAALLSFGCAAKQIYSDNVTDKYGNGQSGVTITILNSDGTTATIYASDGVTPQANPFTTSSTGAYSFSAANGHYIAKVTVGSNNYNQDIYLFDPNDASNILSTSSGSSAARTLASRGADVVNVRDYGAVGDDVTDDSAAINAAASAAKTLVAQAGGAAVLYFPHGRYVLSSSGINLTGIQTRGFDIRGDGATIICKVTGQACIDALGSKLLRWQNLTMYGDTTSTPSIGIQIGRYANSGQGDDQSFVNVNVWGAYTFAAFYNFASETNTYTNLRVFNSYAGTATTCFGIVMDGMNHWNITSQFLTVTATVDSPKSFNENVFVGAQVDTTGGCTPVWMTNTRRHSWIGSYVATESATAPYGLMLYSKSGTDFNAMLTWDVHEENSSMTDAILITGSNASPALAGLRIRDHHSLATNSILKLDTGVTSATVIGGEFDFPFGFTSAINVFNDPTAWTISGTYRLPASSTAWNVTASKFTGIGFVGATTVLTTTGSLAAGATSGIGYTTGAGGAVTQATSRTTGVTLNKVSGAITLVSAAGSATPATFTVTDSAVAATDVPVCTQKSGADKYVIAVTNVTAGAFDITSYTTGGTTTEQPVFNCNVIKGAAS